ncbi:ATP synthase F0 subunit 9 [Tanacetum coccineum]
MLTITDPTTTAPAEAIVAAEVAKLPIRYRRKRHAVTEMKTFKDVMEGLKVIGAGTTTISLVGDAVRIGKIFSLLIHSVAWSP